MLGNNRLKRIQCAVLGGLAILVAGCSDIHFCGTKDPKTGKVYCQDFFTDYQYSAPIRTCSGRTPVDSFGAPLPYWVVTNKFTDSSCGSGLLNQIEWTNYGKKPGTYPDLDTVSICADDIVTGARLTQSFVATGFRQQTPYKCPSTSGAYSVIRLTRFDTLPNKAPVPSGAQITVCDGAGAWSTGPYGFVAVGGKIKSSDCENGVASAVNAQVYRKR